MPTSNSGTGYRAAGTVMMVVGGLVFAVVQSVATAIPASTPHHVHRGLVTGGGMLVTVGAVVLALGVIRSWLAGAMVYVHDRPARRRPVPQSEAKPNPNGELPDAKYLADMSEAVRLGEEIARRKLQPPDHNPN